MSWVILLLLSVNIVGVNAALFLYRGHYTTRRTRHSECCVDVRALHVVIYARLSVCPSVSGRQFSQRCRRRRRVLKLLLLLPLLSTTAAVCHCHTPRPPQRRRLLVVRATSWCRAPVAHGGTFWKAIGDPTALQNTDDTRLIRIYVTDYLHETNRRPMTSDVVDVRSTRTPAFPQSSPRRLQASTVR